MRTIFRKRGMAIRSNAGQENSSATLVEGEIASVDDRARRDRKPAFEADRLQPRRAGASRGTWRQAPSLFPRGQALPPTSGCRV